MNHDEIDDWGKTNNSMEQMVDLTKRVIPLWRRVLMALSRQEQGIKSSRVANELLAWKGR